MPAALAPTALLDEADSHTCNTACQGAISHPETCRCVCLGRNHGGAHVAGRRLAALSVTTRIARTGDVFLGAAAHLDDEPYNVRHQNRTLLLDPEDIF